MQDIEKWPLLARLPLAPRCIFSNSPCIFRKSREIPPLRRVRSRLVHQPGIPVSGTPSTPNASTYRGYGYGANHQHPSSPGPCRGRRGLGSPMKHSSQFVCQLSPGGRVPSERTDLRWHYPRCPRAGPHETSHVVPYSVRAVLLAR
jgi:hypothetical protein